MPLHDNSELGAFLVTGEPLRRTEEERRKEEAISARVEAITTSHRKLLGTKGIATRSKDATSSSWWPYY